MYKLCVALLAVAAAVVVSSAIEVTYNDAGVPLVGDYPCGLDVNGTVFDFSPLVSPDGGYKWSAAWNNTDYTWVMQICGNADPPPACEGVPASPIYQIDSENNCHWLGDIDVSVWSPNPFDDGAFFQMYHGEFISDFTNRQAHVYFVCDEDGTGVPVFEHIRGCETDPITPPNNNSVPFMQYHFSVSTKYACAS